ncbi:cell division/cell wall cluster transcriptional repressor MraZ [Alkalilimnicola ehrlichii]|uniref:Transcriptional regulator MraZ n=1 Tax=Alkalilimnicola ehrlichii TaxID=351052 RepID=A0A3E0WY35_9GAMM|nr:division/cell wall cluster transcriptional repressor MraZ [Alkalilimnicola ehrlichii]RFA30316.1 cell division/cell wall cluster transcriptional repressor MraZ [Alkalilimnicola ehrlichii]RFA37892.1 cell division/cell wall cluster transcriptional repressor MraZ [Alkalilimnicola ehrlichii]
MFRGVSHLNLDAKGRLTFPSRYRERLQAYCEGEMVITVDPDHCLLVYALPDWEVIEAKLAKLPSLKPQNRRLQRLLIGYATECPMDGNGRILLPPPLRDFAGLDKKVVLVGQGNKFELWDEATWNERREVWLAQAAEEMELSAELEELSL